MHRDALRCEKILERRLLAHEKINVLWDSAIDEILGDENPLGVTGVRIKNTKTGETHEVEADGVFIAIGHALNRIIRRAAGNQSGRLSHHG